MEPISITAVATATAVIFFTKTIEKPGEDLGEFLSDKVKALISKLDDRSTKVKNLLVESQQSKDISEVVLEVKAIAQEEPEVAQAIREVEAAALEEFNPKLHSEINRIRQQAKNLEGQQLTVQNTTKLAEKIASVNQGYISTQNITNNF